jgi:hypothetical protein
VTTAQGRRVAEWDLSASEGESGILWNTAKMPEGMYLVTAQFGDTRIAKKTFLIYK